MTGCNPSDGDNSRVADLYAASAEVALTDQALLIERIRPVYGMIGNTAISTLLISMFVAFVLRDQRPQVVMWLGAQIVLKLATQIELRWFYSEAALFANPRWMARRLVFTQALHAIGWASVVWVATQHGSATQQAIVTMVLAGILAGGASTYGPYLPVHTVYLMTFCAVQVTILLLDRAQWSSGSTAVIAPILLIIYSLGLYNNSRVTSRAFKSHIMLSAANVRLAEQLQNRIVAAETARREADAANQAKSRILAAASHDMRQPLHALGLFLGLLERTSLDPMQREMLRNGKAALAGSSTMLNALLDFSQSEAGVIKPQPEPFAIGALFGAIEEEIGILADEKQIIYRTHDSQAVVLSDPALVRMIVTNLVTNAIRYTRQGGVLIGCRRRAGHLLVEVWDSGIGIAPEKLDEIFEEFVQIDNTERDRRKGLGLGLAIAGRLARLLGTEITVRSVEGRGSVFRFALPLADQPVLPVAAAGAQPAPADALRNFAVATSSRHILIVDDDESVRTGLAAILAVAGHSVDAADGFEAALAHVDRRQPDLVICDFRLRDNISGLDVVAAIRQRVGGAVPAILITGDTHPDRIAEAARTDIETLYKPVDPDEILARIAQFCSAVSAPEIFQQTGQY